MESEPEMDTADAQCNGEKERRSGRTKKVQKKKESSVRHRYQSNNLVNHETDDRSILDTNLDANQSARSKRKGEQSP